jgi:mono/diheme cytochrome c family protein
VTDVVSAAIRALKLPGHASWRRPAALVAAVALAGALSACTPGAYTFDIFREMHYQESQRLLEPNRLAPPAGAIPISGKSPAVSFEQAAALQNPVPATDQSRQQARQLFLTNCSACHGRNADGQSEVATRFAAAGAVPPPDFRSSRVQGHTDGQLYWLISNGISNMPPFGDLLTDEQRWTIVQYIRNPQAQ